MTRVSIALLLWWLVCASASAVTVLPMTFDELVGESTAVVFGRVADVRGQWTHDRRAIESLVSVNAIEYFKGSLGDTVTVRVSGGRVGPMVSVMPGAPAFAEGDLVVLFLKTRGPAIPVVTGFTQGVFRVGLDPRTRAPLVQPPALHTAGSGRIARGDATLGPVPLEVLSARVRDAAREPR